MDVVSGDFGGSELDLLIVSQNSAQPDTYRIQIWTLDLDGSQFKILDKNQNTISSLQLGSPNVLIFDSRADMKMDILYKEANSNNHKIWQSGTDTTYIFLQNYNNAGNVVTKSIAWIDINCDCQADLVFAVQSNLYYIAGGTKESNENSQSYWQLTNNNNTQDLKLITTSDGNLDLTQYDMDSILFGDFSRNGAADILIKHKTELKLVLLLQRPNKEYMCGGTSGVEMTRIDLELSNVNLKDSQGNVITNINAKYIWPTNTELNTVILAADINFDQNLEVKTL